MYFAPGDSLGSSGPKTEAPAPTSPSVASVLVNHPVDRSDPHRVCPGNRRQLGSTNGGRAQGDEGPRVYTVDGLDSWICTSCDQSGIMSSPEFGAF